MQIRSDASGIASDFCNSLAMTSRPAAFTPAGRFDGLRKPSQGCLVVGRGRKAFDDNEPVDFTAQESIEEAGIVPKGHASIRLAVVTEHVRMCKHPVATKHVAAVNRIKTDGVNAVKTLLAQ